MRFEILLDSTSELSFETKFLELLRAAQAAGEGFLSARRQRIEITEPGGHAKMHAWLLNPGCTNPFAGAAGGGRAAGGDAPTALRRLAALSVELPDGETTNLGALLKVGELKGGSGTRMASVLDLLDMLPRYGCKRPTRTLLRAVAAAPIDQLRGDDMGRDLLARLLRTLAAGLDAMWAPFEDVVSLVPLHESGMGGRVTAAMRELVKGFKRYCDRRDAACAAAMLEFDGGSGSGEDSVGEGGDGEEGGSIEVRKAAAKVRAAALFFDENDGVIQDLLIECVCVADSARGAREPTEAQQQVAQLRAQLQAADAALQEKDAMIEELRKELTELRESQQLPPAQRRRLGPNGRIIA